MTWRIPSKSRLESLRGDQRFWLWDRLKPRPHGSHKNCELQNHPFKVVRGVFVLVPRVVPRAITTCTWALWRGSRTQNSIEGPKVGLRANGASFKHGWKPKLLKPNKWKMTEKASQDDIANKKPKEQLLDEAFHHSTTGSGLKHDNFNQKLLKHIISIPLLTSAIRQIINNDKFVETKNSWLCGKASVPWDMHEGEGRKFLGILWS